MQAAHHSKFRTIGSALLGLTTMAVLVRLALSAYLPRVIKWDEATNLLLGKNLFEGKGFTYSGDPELHFPPMHPVIAGLCQLLTPDIEFAGNLENALFGGLLLIPVFAIARRIYGLPTAWLAALLLTFAPALTVTVLYWGSMSEPLYLVFLFAGLALLLAGLEEHRIRMFVGSGALLGLAYLTRPEAVMYVGAFMTFSLIWMWRSLRLDRFRVCCSLGLFVLAFLIFAAPYICYLYLNTGQWMVSGKLYITWQAGENTNELSLDQIYNSLDASGLKTNWLSQEHFKENTLQMALRDPRNLLQRVMRNGIKLKDKFFTIDSFWWGLTLLVILGLFNQPWHWQRLKREAFLITIILVLIVTFLPFGFLNRFFAPAYPVLLIWTAKGAIELGNWLQDTVELSLGKSTSHAFHGLLMRWLPAGIITILFIIAIPIAVDRSMSGTFFGDKEAGLWLKANAPASAKVMSEDSAVALYADRSWVLSPNASWNAFMRYARSYKADYLVVRDFGVRKHRPHFGSVLEKGMPELELVFSYEEQQKEELIKTRIYRILTLPVLP